MEEEIKIFRLVATSNTGEIAEHKNKIFALKKDLRKNQCVMREMVLTRYTGYLWRTSEIQRIEKTDYTLTFHTKNSVYVFTWVGSISENNLRTTRIY